MALPPIRRLRPKPLKYVIISSPPARPVRRRWECLPASTFKFTLNLIISYHLHRYTLAQPLGVSASLAPAYSILSAPQPVSILSVSQLRTLSCSSFPGASLIFSIKPKHLPRPPRPRPAPSPHSIPAILAALLFLEPVPVTRALPSLFPLPGTLCPHVFPDSLPHFQSLLKYHLPRDIAFPDCPSKISRHHCPLMPL